MKNLYLEAFKNKIELSVYPSLEDLNGNTLNNYNLVLMGLNLEYPKDIAMNVRYNDIKTLLDLLVKAKRVVIEVSNYPDPQKWFNLLQEILNFNIIKKVVLNNCDSTPLSNGDCVRNLYLIEGMKPIKSYNATKVIHNKVQMFFQDATSYAMAQ